MTSIRFFDTRLQGQRLETKVDRGEGDEPLWFELPFEFTPRNDLIALTFVTLCGKRYESIELDLPISERCVTTLTQMSEAELAAPAGPAFYRRNGHRTALGFSGGYDSLAATEFMPDDAALISLDFGGRFARERQFFERFDTNIIASNFVELGFHRNSWAFMTIGHILLRDVLELSQYSFGTILEASSAFLNRNYEHHLLRLPAMQYLNMTLFNPVAGLTEITTLAIVLMRQPSVVRDCLSSVANVGEAKYFRKHLMVSAVAKHLGMDVDLPKRPEGRHWYSFGDDFANDFLSPFLIRYCGPDAVAEMYSHDLPQELLDYSQNARPELYLRHNLTITDAMPDDHRSSVLRTLAALNIAPYGRDQWRELNDLQKLMRQIGMLTS